jgi:hypothetical protein
MTEQELKKIEQVAGQLENVCRYLHELDGALKISAYELAAIINANKPQQPQQQQPSNTVSLNKEKQ